MKQVDFYYDVVSPYSYLASTQVEAIVADCGATLAWKPMFLGGLMKSVGNTPPAFLAPRGRYMLKDLLRWSAYYGVPFRMPAAFPTNTLTAMRALAGLADDQVPDASHRLFHAYWADGLDLGDKGVLAELLGAEALERAALPEIKQRLMDTTSEAEGRGAFGAPTFHVGDQMFFGNDRLPFLEQTLRA